MVDFYSSESFEAAYTYSGTDLGAVWSSGSTFFRLWAPTARSVSVKLYESGTEGIHDLIRTVPMAKDVQGTWIAVIEGDIASNVDAERIKKQGIPAVQINTGGACHLESAMIKRAVDVLDLDRLDLIIIENVGNLVCPTDFDLGENIKVMILSVPEGDDKPLKYPLMFSVCDTVIINKIDVMDYFDFDMERCRRNILSRNPQARIIPVSAKTGEGMEAVAQWLLEEVRLWKAQKD